MRSFDCRFSRHLSVSENAFGIWEACFAFSATRVQLSPEKTKNTVMASLVLHNILRTESEKNLHPTWIS